MTQPVVCPYCHRGANPVEIYRRPGVTWKIWLCQPCDAWVPAQDDRPMGTPAKSALRSLRASALSQIERLWRLVGSRQGWPEERARRLTYEWLARELRIPVADCNIYAFDMAKAQMAIDICAAVMVRKRAA